MGIIVTRKISDTIYIEKKRYFTTIYRLSKIKRYYY